MTQTKWLIAAAPAVPTLFLGFTLGLLMPQTTERIRSTLYVAVQQWRHGEVPVNESTTEDDLRAENAQLTHYLQQAEWDLSSSIGLLQSDREAYRQAQESAELNQELAETLIQFQITRPMLVLAPTPEEAEDEPEAQDPATTVSGTQPKNNNGGT